MINTIHGSIDIPAFFPDATRGFVKLCSNEELKIAGVRQLMVNTFHLYLSPGTEVIKKAGGLHNFIGWDRPIMSDSGGYQIFSLIHKNPKMGKIYEDKVIFKSPIDGSNHELTPEKSISVQFDLGVDIMVCLDDCPPVENSKKEIEKSVERTIEWAKRCKTEYEKQINSLNGKLGAKSPIGDLAPNPHKIIKPLLVAVIQGGRFKTLRKKCALALFEIGFDGYGFGGRHYDSKGKLMEGMLKYTAELIGGNGFKFALGIGTPSDIIKCHESGWDMFDCVIPTREGRHGRIFNAESKNLKIFTSKNKISRKQNPGHVESLNILNAKYSLDFSAISETSEMEILRKHSLAYLHYLFKTKDRLGSKIASLHNLESYSRLMEAIRSPKDNP